ncbi:MAG: IS66 family transposase [Rhodobacteraceae bacterium]|nr:IS66 family transposase [Paracoccaceae bacterium]
MIVELLATLQAERLDKDQLRHRIALLLQQKYGPRTERINPDQLLLFAEWALPDGAAPTPSTAAVTTDSKDTSSSSGPSKPKTPHGRGKLPDKLPRHSRHHILTEAERTCACGTVRIEIGTDVSEQVDWQPASIIVWQDIVHKYLCPTCAKKTAAQVTPSCHSEDPVAANAPDAATPDAPAAAPTQTATPRGPAVISAPKPPAPLAKGLPGSGLLAYIIVSKYFDHLPLYRLEHILKRQGLPLSRSTMCDWMAASAAALTPLYDIMVSQMLQSAWLHTDDTPVKNQGHEPGTTALSRFWIYWGDRAHPYNVFDFTINRKRDGPQQFLEGFRGYLHADAFSGYDGLYVPSPRDGVAPIIEVACNAHARRKFHEARGSDDALAHQALAYYGQLYTLENGAKAAGLDDAGRRAMRQELAVPILEKFHAWLVVERDRVLPKSPMAEAIGYALNNWTALIRYTEQGFLMIDNNTAEREMKRIAIGRKNWLFVGSDNGGRTAAVLFSFTSTCHRLGVEPWAYLQDVLTRLPSTPAERLPELLPDRWQAARAATTPTAAATTSQA